MSKEKTEDQVRKEFLAHIRHLVDSWDGVSEKTCREKLSGLAFSILVAIDGEAYALPSFILAPCPHKDDAKYHISNNEDYYPENHKSSVKCNIAGGLHDQFYENEK